jgi:hypothetical protein
MHKKYQLSLKLQNNMNSFLRFPRIPNLVAFFMLLSYLYVTFRYAFDIHKGGDPYLTGDWLINYAGGYTSRGLVGQVLFSFSETFGFNLMWTTYLFQVLIYSVYIFPVIFIVRQISDPFIWVIGLSPFFVIFDFLDTGGSFRKENLGFACISLLALAIVLKSKTHLLLVLAATVFLLLSFSWEGAISFIPMVVFLLLNLYRNSRISKLVLFFNFGVYSLTILLSYIGVIFSQNHLSASASMQVCESLKSQGIGESICVGRISSINKNGQIRVFDNLSTMWVQYNGTKFLLLLLLALLPFMLSGWIRSNKFTFFALSISVVPLFLVPTDYGRNYHILGVVLSMAWCVDRVKTISHPSQGSVITEKQLSPIFIVLSFLYTILWRIPALGAPSGEEFLGVAGRLISWGKKLIILMS